MPGGTGEHPAGARSGRAPPVGGLLPRRQPGASSPVRARSSPGTANDRRRAVALFAEDLAAWRAEQGCPALLSAQGEAWDEDPSRAAVARLPGPRETAPDSRWSRDPASKRERRQVFLDVLGQPVCRAAAPALGRRGRDGRAAATARRSCRSGSRPGGRPSASTRSALNAANAFSSFREDRSGVANAGGAPRRRRAHPRGAPDARRTARRRTGAGSSSTTRRSTVSRASRRPSTIRDGRVRLPGGDGGGRRAGRTSSARRRPTGRSSS